MTKIERKQKQKKGNKIEKKRKNNKQMRQREQKQKICNEIKLKCIWKEKSEKMKGINNHNFGKKFSQETKQKMSQSIRDTKGSVSDEIIQEVKKLIELGKKNTEIQILLNLQRHTVSRIKNGNIICRNEIKNERKSLTQEEINISKRKIKLSEIFMVIENCIEGNKPSFILNLLVEKRNENHIENTLTIDIIKNIKRNIQQNKLPFYPNELSEEKYNYYKELIDLYTNKTKCNKEK